MKKNIIVAVIMAVSGLAMTVGSGWSVPGAVVCR